MKVQTFVLASALTLFSNAFSQEQESTGLTVDADGNIGINTKTPNSSLEVNGETILGGKLTLKKNFEVTNSYPDNTVFESTEDRLRKCNLFKIGTLNPDTSRTFNFFDMPINPASAYSYQRFSTEDRNNMARFVAQSFTNYRSDLYLYDYQQSKGVEFHVWNDYGTFEFTQPNSIMLIGGKLGFDVLRNNVINKNIKLIVKGNSIIEGDLNAKTVTVPSQSFADYVFKSNYTLKPLKEVEQYINTNGHLEGMPSEKEVIKNGIDLKELTIKQQEKIEELTLYIIEMNKKLEALQKKINN